MEWLNEYHLGGIAIGICTFLIIGLFHPIVVKAEYYWGTRCWWIFLVLGIAGIIGTVLISDILISSLLGVFSFSSFWTIKEIFEQHQMTLSSFAHSSCALRKRFRDSNIIRIPCLQHIKQKLFHNFIPCSVLCKLFLFLYLKFFPCI